MLYMPHTGISFWFCILGFDDSGRHGKGGLVGGTTLVPWVAAVSVA